MNLKNPDLIFYEGRHRYTLNGKVIVSVTTFLDKFFEKFDRYGIAYRLAESDKYKALGKDMKSILAEWEGAGERGTKVHKEIEGCLSDGWDSAQIIDPKTSQAMAFISSLRVDYPGGVIYPELRICSDNLGIAGTIDCLLVLGNEFIIIDWKTNEKLSDKGFDGKRGIHPLTKDMDDCHISKYGLQLQGYAYILELEYGLKCKGLILVHLQDDKWIGYNIVYDKEKIKSILTAP